MKKSELKRVSIKNRACYYFDDVIEIEDFDLDNILLDEKSYENILISGVLYKTLIGVKPSGLGKSHTCVCDVLEIKNCRT